MKTTLKYDKCAGDQIPKDLFPKRYREKELTNLYIYDHSGGYRSCYTIVPQEGTKGCPAILDILTHEQYIKLFGYKKD
jgi:hypothetical protein